MPSDQVALMIIRAWLEEGSSEPLRAHIRLSFDVSVGFARTLTVSRPEEVIATVEEWLAEVVGGTEGAPGPQPSP